MDHLLSKEKVARLAELGQYTRRNRARLGISGVALLSGSERSDSLDPRSLKTGY